MIIYYRPRKSDTSLNLTKSITVTNTELEEIINIVRNQKDNATITNKLATLLEQKRELIIQKIRDWFIDNHNDLLYECNDKIPWAVVKNIRSSLSFFVVGICNPFEKDINDAIIDIAEENGYKNLSTEESWEAMGGKIFTKK